MNWKTKARIMSFFSKVPLGETLYVTGQKYFGRLDSNPLKRLPHSLSILSLLRTQNLNIKDKVLFEIGTGHLPILPMLFYLAGSAKIYTYDLNKRLQFSLVKKCLEQILLLRETIETSLKDFVDADILEHRFEIMQKYINDPKAFLENANILYCAPADASKTNLENEIIDIHFSCTTFEHIPTPILAKIMQEGHRILKKDGVSVHIIDPSDHFEHQDKLISKINFLQYSEKEWDDIANNQFAYCNRVRSPEFRKLFLEVGFKVLMEEKITDPRSLESLKNGFHVDEKFKIYSNEEICTVTYSVLLGK